MKCLLKYKWVKIPRDYPDMGKGLMAHWVKLASRAAFRKGNATYCGYTNPVQPGMWSGGVVGVKRILGLQSRTKALQALDELSELGYLTYTLDKQTKKLTYQITDWVIKCSGAECLRGAVYATQGYGFLCLPRSISERLIDKNRIFSEADAWLDLWCHTTFEDFGNAFSFLAPTIQFGKYGSVLSMEILGKRWNWEKTKVWRFLKKHSDTFVLYPLPGAYGCVLYNSKYPTGTEVLLPAKEEVLQTLQEIRNSAKDVHTNGTDNERINRIIAWRSRRVLIAKQNQSGKQQPETRVAVSHPITRTYFSHGWNCNTCRNCIYDCQGKFIGRAENLKYHNLIRGPCRSRKP